MYANGTAPRSRKERKVSIVFRHPDDGKHCAGVDSLLFPLVPNHKLLFTASRDSTVKRWDVAGPEPVLEASFEGHADWVNDLALIGDLLITASNDQTVRLWKAGSENGQHLHTLSYHSDYVTCLAAAPARSMVVSAGLRAEIFLLNIETGKHTQLYPQSSRSAPSLATASSLPTSSYSPTNSGGGLAGLSSGAADDSGPYSVPVGGLGSASVGPAKDQPGSVYALALNPAGSVVAAGTSEALIRLLDPRCGKKITKLRGHTDTVRALLVNSDGTLLLSGASDGTIKLWDVGMQRCVQTYTVHNDSVWSLLSPDDSFSVIYSGGRDRAIYRTHTQSRTSELLVAEEGPITAMAMDPQLLPGSTGPTSSSSGMGLWASTTFSHVNLWALPRGLPGGAAGGGDGGRSFSVARRSLGNTANMRHRSLTDNSRQPLARTPAMVIHGVPGIVQHEVLADRRHVLTMDARGHVGLWDVMAGAQVAAYGKVDFAAKRLELWEPRSVPSWFSSDNRLGALAISLEPPAAFAAEEYAVQLGYSGMSDDCKVNYGKLVLDCAFAKWRFHHTAAHNRLPAAPAASNGTNGHFPQGLALPPAQPHLHGSLASAVGGGGHHVAHGDGHASGVGGQVAYYQDLWPKYWSCKALPAVICSRPDGQRWRRLLNGFDGSELEPGEVPSWVGDVVLRSTAVTPKEAKCAFVLQPADGSPLPPMQQAKLNAPRILQAHKVAHYCVSKLQEQNVVLEVRPFYLRRPPQAPPDPPTEAAGGLPALGTLELMCNGVAVPFEMSLASIKKFIWKKSDELIFHYKIRDPGNPAPPPALAPPNS